MYIMINNNIIKPDENKLKPLPQNKNILLNKFYPFIKRTNDIIFSMLFLPLVIPILIIVVVWIKLDSKGPVLYKQKRAGKDGNPFYLIKLRTMVQDADKYGIETDEDDPRITKVGKTIRQFRLDEIPQIINILKGDMSFVGPRAQPIEYAEDWKREGILDVKPGIFCWYQLNFKDVFIPEKVFECEREYIDNFSWETDSYIVFTTLGKYKQLIYWVLIPFSIIFIVFIITCIYYFKHF